MSSGSSLRWLWSSPWPHMWHLLRCFVVFPGHDRIETMLKLRGSQQSQQTNRLCLAAVVKFYVGGSRQTQATGVGSYLRFSLGHAVIGSA